MMAYSSRKLDLNMIEKVKQDIVKSEKKIQTYLIVD